MKTIWEVIVVVVLAIIITGGISTLGNQIFTTQTLTNESVNDLSGYSSLALAYNNNFSSRINETKIDPYKETDVNQVSEFIQEYNSYKGKIDQLNDGIKLIYKMPDLVIYVIPFVDVADLKQYADLYRILVWILIMLLVIIALKNGQVIPQT